MNAKIGTRFNSENRTRLETVIPLETPYLLFVDPSSVCNLKCIFCPCGGAYKENWSNNKRVNLLPYSDYREIIAQTLDFPQKIKTLRLYKEGEPLMNKRLPDMIQYAKKREVAGDIDFTTNGTLLNPDLNFALIDAGVDRMNISIEALDEGGYEKNAGLKIDYKKFLKNLRHLYQNKGQCHILMKISDVGLGKHSEQDFFEMFGDMCDEMAIEHITPVWPEFNLEEKIDKDFEQGIYGNTIRDMKVCPHIFYSICVNSDMSVSACLMDWNHYNIIGNLKENTLKELWSGEKMNNMRILNLKGRRKELGICANCGQLPYAALDNLDPYADMLLRKLENK